MLLPIGRTAYFHGGFLRFEKCRNDGMVTAAATVLFHGINFPGARHAGEVSQNSGASADIQYDIGGLYSLKNGLQIASHAHLINQH